jgi:hypothetical protein
MLLVLAYGVWALFRALRDRRRVVELTVATLSTIIIVGLVIWPFHAHSPDFRYMIMDYVADVPIQTQSALVGFLFFEAYNTSSHTSALPFLQYQIPILFALVMLVTLWAVRRGHDLWSIGALALLLFVLFSKKVMGYYYLPLVAFLLIELFRRGKLSLYLGVFLAIAWISISPFYAPFSAEDHLIFYFLLGLFNTLLFLWLFLKIARESPDLEPQNYAARPFLLLQSVLSLQVVVYVTVFSQPFSRLRLPEMEWTPVGAWQRPIEFELTAPGQEINTLIFLALLLTVILVIATWGVPRVIAIITGHPARKLSKMAAGTLLLFFPLYFNLYYLSKESTASFEFILRTLLR